MKNRYFCPAKIVLSLCIAAAGFPSFAAALDTGAVAPDFELSSLSSSKVSLSEFKGRVVYLDFWASWCAPCKHTLPWMNSLHDKFKDKGVNVVAVSVDTDVADASKAMSTIGPRYTVAVDVEGKAAALYEPPKMPTSFLIGKDGKIVKVFAGFHEGDETQIEAAITELVGK
jgi:thiol-disulfide isomerase/thioredoxin